MHRTEIAIREAIKAIPEYRAIRLVGSTFIRESKDSDVDVLMLVDTLPELPCPWDAGGSGGDDNGNWLSWKRTVDGVEVNLLAVNSVPYYLRWIEATEVCRFLHMRGVTLKTSDVHGVHAIVMDGSNSIRENNWRNY